jgi:dihydrofolate reductase
MPRTQYFTATSVDGYIADQDNSLEWLFQAEKGTDGGDGWSGQQYRDFFAEVGALAMGATTYEWIVERERMLAQPANWPYAATPCWVFSHRQLPAVPGADLTFVSGDVVAVHEQMQAAAGERNVWLVGGGELVGQFADRGLLDEIILSVAPATLGGGSPLLPRRLMPGQLRLSRCWQDGPFACLSYSVR